MSRHAPPSPFCECGQYADRQITHYDGRKVSYCEPCALMLLREGWHHAQR